MLRQNGKGYLLSAMLGGTSSSNACSVPREMKCEHATPLVLLDQSAIESIEIMPRSGRKGKCPNDGSKYAPPNVVERRT